MSLPVSFARLDAPIVLAHGLGGFSRIGVGPVTLATYFRGIPEAMQSAGNRVLVTQVPPLAGVDRRSARLGEQIEQALGDQPVHLIGHSMGGLDARALLTRDGWAKRILSLTTLATPHLGSPLADLAKLHAGRAYDWARRLRIETEGFVDVTRRQARLLNRQAVPPPGVACFSVAGVPSRRDVCAPLRRFYDVLERLEGPNDGLVSLASATAFGTPLRSWPLDHLRQMNWWIRLGRTEIDPTVAECYVSLLENLIEHGFGWNAPARRGAVRRSRRVTG
jgi:triacylglycerol lipase